MSAAAEVTEDRVLEVLKTVRFPGLSRDIVSFGFVKDLTVGGGNVAMRLEIMTESAAAAEEIQRDATEKLRALPGVDAVTIRLEIKSPASAQPRGARRSPVTPRPPILAGGPVQDRRRLRQGRRRQVHRRREPGPRARARSGARVGLHGRGHLRPSQQMMMGIDEKPVRQRATTRSCRSRATA